MRAELHPRTASSGTSVGAQAAPQALHVAASRCACVIPFRLLSMGAILRSDAQGREAVRAAIQNGAHGEGLAAGRRERVAEVEVLRRDIATVTAAAEARTSAAVTGWLAAFEIMRNTVGELAKAVEERVPLASAHPGGTRETLLEAFRSRLRQIPAPPGGWPKG